jgi:hypothetical protein
MPSNAYQLFKKNLIDVDRLIESHEKLKSGNQGKQGLGHITRSGVLMLCAAWEVYVEELVKEAAVKFAEKVDSPDNLPKQAQKQLSNFVKNSKDELKPLSLAGDGWKEVYLENTTELTDKFNTPKSS